MQRTNDLKSGYSTGSHAASALKAALIAFFEKDAYVKNVQLLLPENNLAELKIEDVVKSRDYIKVSVIKSDNDDIDATKGCKIICWLGINISNIPCELNEQEHKPHVLKSEFITLNIWAGRGLGVATKGGLNTLIGYAAINPVPLSMMLDVVKEISSEANSSSVTLNAIFEVENGIEIAQNTANPKVGIVGGISFLGKKGVVKPVSTLAYLESLKTEFNVAYQYPDKTVILTMGNSCLDFSKKYYGFSEECFIEIGNFIFDSLNIVSEYKFLKVIIVANIGKLTKIAQQKKNTNNRYGSIDFFLIKAWLADKFPDDVVCFTERANTVAEIEVFIKKYYFNYLDVFYELLSNKAMESLKTWSEELNLNNIEIEVVLTDGQNLKRKTNANI